MYPLPFPLNNINVFVYVIVYVHVYVLLVEASEDEEAYRCGQRNIPRMARRRSYEFLRRNECSPR